MNNGAPNDARQRLYSVYSSHLLRRGHLLTEDPSVPPTPIDRPWLPAARTVRVLELGCGGGDLLRRMRASGYSDLTGIDSSSFQIDRARARGDGVSYEVADAKAYLDACEQTFGLVLAFDFIEHLTVEEALEVCDLVYRVLDSRGCFVIQTPNASSLLASYGFHSDLTHVTQYTEYSLFQLLDAVGFEQHQILRPTLPPLDFRHMLRWRSALHLRRRTNHLLHRLAYWARAQRPPLCFEMNLEVWTYRP